MTDDPDGSPPSACFDDLQQPLFLIARAQRDDLLSELVPIADHAVEVQRQEVRLEDPELLLEVAQVGVAVMEVVHAPDVRMPGLPELLDDPDLVGRFPEPTEMVVQSDRAPALPGLGTNGPEGFDRRPDLLLQHGQIGLRLGAQGHPELRMDSGAVDAGEDGLGLGIQRRREPPGRDVDVVLPHRGHFGIKGGNMLGAPVIGQPADSQPFQHFSPCLGPTFLGVEWHDAPRHEVGLREEPFAGQGHGHSGQQQRQDTQTQSQPRGESHP